MSLRQLHRATAVVITVYAAVHIANHLAALKGIEAHIAFMRAARTVYRAGVVEWVLLAAVSVQVATGITALVRGWREREGFVPWLQAGSGAYLALFLLNHVGAVLYGRSVGLDTNFHFAAAGLHVHPFQYYFAPYYFLAVLALFLHLGCALYRQCEHRGERVHVLALAVPALVGAVVSIAIVLAMAGAFYPVSIPDQYKATFRFN
jgi:hypothetical protein